MMRLRLSGWKRALPFAAAAANEPNTQEYFMNTIRIAKPFSIFALYWVANAAVAQSCTPINALPASLTASGNYCLTQSLSSAVSSGAAISVSAADVHIDLGGFVLDGTAAGTASTASGVIYSSTQRGLRIRNGTIRGFLAATNAGVLASNPNAIVLEDLRIESSRGHGLIVVGDHSIVRRVVIDGVTPFGTQTTAMGITGFGNRQRYNDVDIMGVAEPAGGVGAGISCSSCIASIVENSRIAGGAGGGTFRGMWLGGASVARRNAINNADDGLRFSGTGSKYQDNIFTSVTTNVVGSVIDAGGNF
jgi:hypothetical protein